MKVNLYGEDYEINRIELNRYQADNTLAIQLYCIDKEYGFEEPFATLTVCLDVTRFVKDKYKDMVRKDVSFLDTNN